MKTSYIITIILLIIAIFLGKELLKKFWFMQEFIRDSNQIITFEYEWNKKSWMYNIVLRWEKPFSALIGFKLEIPILWYSWFDYYGFIKSDKNNTAILSTYLSKKPIQFKFMINSDLTNNNITVSSDDKDEILKPNKIFPPHWYQRLGFYE